MSAPKVGTAVIVLDEDRKILLGKRRATNHEVGRYGCPGGKMDFGETPMEAATRELYEETQLGLRTNSLLHPGLKPLPIIANCVYPAEDNHFVCFWFTAAVNGKAPPIDFIEKNEAGEAKMESWNWYSLEELKTLPIMLSTMPAYHAAIVLWECHKNWPYEPAPYQMLNVERA